MLSFASEGREIWLVLPGVAVKVVAAEMSLVEMMLVSPGLEPLVEESQRIGKREDLSRKDWLSGIWTLVEGQPIGGT